MRLPSVALFKHTSLAAVPPARELAERGRDVANEVAGAVRTAMGAEMLPRRSSHRGRTALTVTAVAATALVATAAYVWWKRRDQLVVEPSMPTEHHPSAPAHEEQSSQGSATAVASTPAWSPAPQAPSEQPPANAPGAWSPAPEADTHPTEPPTAEQHVEVTEASAWPIADARVEVQHPAAVPRPPQGAALPPTATSNGRFAMPSVRRLVLPSVGRGLPRAN